MLGERDNHYTTETAEHDFYACARLNAMEFPLNAEKLAQNFNVWRKQEQRTVFPPSFERGTFRVWGKRDNHYTTETAEYDFYACARLNAMEFRVKRWKTSPKCKFSSPR